MGGNFFNNIFQVGGSAVGFGQTEPGEFWRFDANGQNSELARAKGYLVHNLPPRTGRKLTAALDDFTSVKVACAMVRDLFEHGKKTKKSIMNAYGGVGFTGVPPEYLKKPGGREKLIQGILDCGEALKKAKTQDEIIAALKIARDFNQEDQFRKILFPARDGIWDGAYLSSFRIIGTAFFIQNRPKQRNRKTFVSYRKQNIDPTLTKLPFRAVYRNCVTRLYLQ